MHLEKNRYLFIIRAGMQCVSGTHTYTHMCVPIVLLYMCVVTYKKSSTSTVSTKQTLLPLAFQDNEVRLPNDSEIMTD